VRKYTISPTHPFSLCTLALQHPPLSPALSGASGFFYSFRFLTTGSPVTNTAILPTTPRSATFQDHFNIKAIPASPLAFTAIAAGSSFYSVPITVHFDLLEALSHLLLLRPAHRAQWLRLLSLDARHNFNLSLKTEKQAT